MRFRVKAVPPPTLLCVPNVSEGRDGALVEAIADAFAAPCGEQPMDASGTRRAPADGALRLLDVHRDPDHHRSVFTLAGRPGALADGLLRGARIAVQRVDVMARAGAPPAERGVHPHVGAVDVVPIVYLDGASRGAACAEALVVGDRIGNELQVPVFLYGDLAGADGLTRAELRRGGVVGLAERMRIADGASGARRPDFGPPRLHPSAGASLIAAREPLVAFNLQLQAPAGVAEARRVAALVRESPEGGLPGVRAIGVALGDGLAQVSINIERPLELSLAEVVRAVAGHAPVASAELVGLAPRAALAGFPEDLPIPGFDPARHVIENALGS